MNTKADLMAYLTTIGAAARIVTYFTRMSDARVALFLSLHCSNSEAGVDQQLTRFH